MSSLFPLGTAAETAAAESTTTAASAAGGNRIILNRFNLVVVVGDVGQDRRRVKEEQGIDQEGNGGDHDAWEGRMPREAGEG
ncbi:hypothetical protein PG996_006012 [Apiospora saccharicola]|uniref:Uncharacterized protein n=1 Tax=Apiospora saccharicola TaxID=335842 RepID=A0ABR1VRY1_9PEZI